MHQMKEIIKEYQQVQLSRVELSLEMLLQITNETYYKNYVFDDISDEFNGIENTFTLTAIWF